MEKKVMLLIAPLILISAIFLLYWNYYYKLDYALAVLGLYPPEETRDILNGAVLYDLGAFLLVIGSIMGASYVTWHWVQFSKNTGLLSLSLISSTSLLGSGIIMVVLEFGGLHPSYWDFDWVFLGILFVTLGAIFFILSLILCVMREAGKRSGF